MSSSLLPALIGFLAIVIFGPLANHVWTKYRESRTLALSVTASEAPSPRVVKGYIRSVLDERAADTALGLPEKIKIDKERDALLTLQTYIKVSLHNPGRKVLTKVRVRINPKNELWINTFYQIGTEETTEGPELTTIEFGEIQPHQTRILQIWTSAGLASLSPSYISDFFDITADEYDRRPFHFPLPVYLRLHQDALGWTVIRWIGAALVVASMIYSVRILNT